LRTTSLVIATEVREDDGMSSVATGTDPFAQLERSHRRLEERLEDLAQADAAHVDVVRDVAAFFARAVKRHEQDEEESLFPRLRGHAELVATLERLAREHVEHAALHERLDRVIEAIDAGAPEAARDLARTTTALMHAYRDHVDEEERVLFPAARALLDEAALVAISEEMAARRRRTS
jgi:hemerythrin-like domain-containing protein